MQTTFDQVCPIYVKMWTILNQKRQKSIKILSKDNIKFESIWRIKQFEIYFIKNAYRFA